MLELHVNLVIGTNELTLKELLAGVKTKEKGINTKQDLTTQISTMLRKELEEIFNSEEIIELRCKVKESRVGKIVQKEN